MTGRELLDKQLKDEYGIKPSATRNKVVDALLEIFANSEVESRALKLIKEDIVSGAFRLAAIKSEINKCQIDLESWRGKHRMRENELNERESNLDMREESLEKREQQIKETLEQIAATEDVASKEMIRRAKLYDSMVKPANVYQETERIKGLALILSGGKELNNEGDKQG